MKKENKNYVVLVVKDYNDMSENKNNKLWYKNKIRNLKKGEIYIVKNLFNWWLEIDSKSNVINDHKKYIISTYCIPIKIDIDIDIDKINKIQLENISIINCEKYLYKNITKKHLYYYPKLYKYYNNIPYLFDNPNNFNIFNKITYHWLNKLIYIGNNRNLVLNDIWNINYQNKSKITSKKLNNFLKNEKLFKNNYLINIIFKMFKKQFIFLIFVKLIIVLMDFISPFLLGQIIIFIKNPTLFKFKYLHGYFLATLYFLSELLQLFIENKYLEVIGIYSNKIRCMLMSSIYKKMINLDIIENDNIYSNGDQMNLLSIDCFQIQEAINVINELWAAPLHIFCISIYIGYLIGVSMFSGFSIIFILVPINIIFAKKISKLMNQQMNYKDIKISWIDQMLNGIKFVKLYTWENFFLNNIITMRLKELQNFKVASYINCILILFWELYPLLIFALSVITYVYLYSKINVEIIFMTNYLICLISYSLTTFPNALNCFIKMKVSIKRLEKFFKMKKMNKNIEQNKIITFPILIKNASLGWCKNYNNILFENLNISINNGQFIAVIGKTGSGKSTFISSILGITKIFTGNIYVNGSLSYVGQTPWIQNKTVKQNILFGNTYKKQLFENVIEKCCLLKDIENLPCGLESEIGEKGTNLSGGQKQRICIARAVYNNSDIYLLDDVLSAVDPHVSNSIFDNVFSNNGLLANKTRILVTHQLDFLPKVDRIIVINCGKIIFDGNYNELVKNYIYTTFDLFKSSNIVNINNTDCKIDLLDSKIVLQNNKNNINNVNEIKKTKLISKEKLESGNIKCTMFKKYFKSMNYLKFGTFILLIFLSNLFSNIGYYLSGVAASDGINYKNYKIFLKYFGIILSSIFFLSFSGSLLFVLCVYQSSQKFHNKLLKRICKAQMKFFENTPLGRIINVFSNDIYTLDVLLPKEMEIFIRIVMYSLTTFGLVSYEIPFFIIPFIFTFIFYIFIQNKFISSSRQLQRLDAASKSPIFSQFLESSQGIHEIKAFGKKKEFFQRFCQAVDLNQTLRDAIVISNSWLGLRLDIIGNILVYFASLLGIFSSLNNNILPGGLGYIIVSTSSVKSFKTFNLFRLLIF